MTCHSLSLQAVAGQPGVAGYVLAGLGTGESPELRQRIVEAVLQKLPAGMPRMLSSVGTPEEVLEAVAQVGKRSLPCGQCLAPC